MKTIQLTQGKVAFVDDDLFEQLNTFSWSAKKDRKTYYATRRVLRPDGKPTTQLMHRDVFRLRNEEVPVEIDHQDRDGLNNCRINLRAADRSEQIRNQGRRADNTSGFTGVRRDHEKWRAYVKVDGKNQHLGRFDDPFSAAWVRDEYVKRRFPEFGVTNNLTDRRVADIPTTPDRRKQPKS